MSERYKHPTPIFKSPKDNGLLSPQDQSHHVPSLSVVDKVKQEGWEDIADILARAKAMAKEQAIVIEANKQKKSSSKKTSSAPDPVPFSIPEIDSNFILSNEEFIRRTRAGNGFNIHDPEVKKLFFANGGADFFSPELSFVTCFENLRRAKLYSMKKDPIITEYNRCPPVPNNVRRYISGLPSARKFTAIQEAKIRSKNEGHYGFVSPAKRKA